MEYTVNQLAKLSGVSARTLRYYDQIGLLPPARIAQNGYRVYGTAQVDRLQQILFYRALGMPLEEIGQILTAPDFDAKAALKNHLSTLAQQKADIEALIATVTKTIRALEGEATMSDHEKFEGFKHRLVEENEQTYGKECRSRYGDEAIDAANAKMSGMSETQWQQTQALGEQINTLLAEAFAQGDPACESAQKACDLHRRWLCMFWKNGTYSKQAHRALAEGYVADPRFTAYYDRIGAGCTAFFRDAIALYCKD